MAAGIASRATASGKPRTEAMIGLREQRDQHRTEDENAHLVPVEAAEEDTPVRGRQSRGGGPNNLLPYLSSCPRRRAPRNTAIGGDEGLARRGRVRDRERQPVRRAVVREDRR